MTKLFALGSNSNGQLGIGSHDDVCVPTLCTFTTNNHNNHNHPPQPHYQDLLGPHDDLDDLPHDDRIVKVVAGGNHTLVRFASGAVFAAGSNAVGECGLPTGVGVEGEGRSVFRRVVLRDGYDGSPAEGGNPLEGDGEGEAPVSVFGDVAATWEASFFVTGTKIHVRGRGARGELGLGEGVEVTADAGTDVITLVPDEMAKGCRVAEIKSGMSHTVVRTQDGRLLGWGAGRKGQLGEESKHQKVIWKPQELRVPPHAAKVAVGRDFTFVVGEAERWHWLLGDSKYEADFLPDLKTLVIADDGDEGEGTYDLTSSWSNIYALTHSNGQLKGWGRNDRGQLPPKDLPKLKAVAAGSEHCVGLTVDGEVVAWGWGEHGNCGPDIDAQANVAGGRWNVLPVPLSGNEEVVGVGAGCATTFIIVSETV